MSLIFGGTTRCAICETAIDVDSQTVSTTAFIENSSDPLWKLSDAAMHSSCFANWALRRRFIDAFNAYYAKHYRGIRVMLEDGSIEEREPAS